MEVHNNQLNRLFKRELLIKTSEMNARTHTRTIQENMGLTDLKLAKWTHAHIRELFKKIWA